MVQRYALTDASGKLIAFYADDVFPDGNGVPPAAVPISESDWTVWCVGQNAYRLIDGVLTVYTPPPAES